MQKKITALLTFIFKSDYFKATVFYLGLICLVYSPIVFYGKTLSMSARYPWFSNNPPEQEAVMPNDYPNIFNVDIASPAAFEEPVDAFIGNQLRKGRFPLWNPFISCGTVVQDQFSTRTLFPYQLLQNICPWGWRDLFLLGRLFLAAMGLFIFLRLRGISFYPALCGGAMYGLSGAMTVFLTLTQMSNLGMMLPYTLVASQLIIRRVSIYSVFFCSLVLALVVLGGQPEVAFYGLLFVFAYHLLRSAGNSEQKFAIKSCLAFFVALTLAFLISSPSFVPFLLNYSQYYSFHPAGGNQGVGSTPLVNFIAVFIPELLRWRAPVVSLTFNYGWDRLGGYAGLTCIFLIIANLRRYWWGRRELFFFAGFALLILLKNLGFPPVSWIGRLPVFDQVWTPRWAGPVWNLSLILAAAFGFEVFLSRNQDEQKKDIENYTGYNPPSLLIPIGVEALVLALFALLNTKFSILMDIVSRNLNIAPIVTWNLFFIVLAALGFLIIFILRPSASKKQDFSAGRFKPVTPWKLISEILILSCGIFFNVALWSAITNGSNPIADLLSNSTLLLLRVFCIVMSGLITYYAIKRLALPPPFAAFLIGIGLCVFNFQAQALEVRDEYGFWGQIFGIQDKVLAFSLWLALIESIIFSLFLMINLFLVWKRKHLDQNILALIVSVIILIEVSFHVTVGFDEAGRLFYLVLHLGALIYLISVLAGEQRDPRIKLKRMAMVFCAGMFFAGVLAYRCLPDRQDKFTVLYDGIKASSFSRTVGVRGVLFPNAAAALGIQDVNGIVSLSIKRFQLFQDNCLRSWPNRWQDGLWLTGVMDARGGSNIFRNTRDRHYFYSLVGVENYLVKNRLSVPFLKLINDSGLKRYYNEAAMPRAFIVPKWSVVFNSEDALQWMLNNSFTFKSEGVVEGSDIQDVFYLSEDYSVWAEIKSYDLHSVVIEAQTDVPGLLILTDAYHPDWRVKVDGANQKVYPADLCFRGVFLKPGKHQVRFFYFPRVFYLCAGVSILLLLGMFILSCRPLWIRCFGTDYAKHKKQ